MTLNQKYDLLTDASVDVRCVSFAQGNQYLKMLISLSEKICPAVYVFPFK